MWAMASAGGVVSGEVDGGDEELEEFGVELKKEGDGKPELPTDGLVYRDPPGLWSKVLVLLGRPCWKRQRVPYKQKPKELKVRHRAPRGFHSLVGGWSWELRAEGVFTKTSGVFTKTSGVFTNASGVFGPLLTSPASSPSMCRKLQRVPKGQTPKERKVRQGMFLRRRRTGRCSVELWTNRQRLP